jgi:hypothetical protein
MITNFYKYFENNSDFELTDSLINEIVSRIRKEILLYPDRSKVYIDDELPSENWIEYEGKLHIGEDYLDLDTEKLIIRTEDEKEYPIIDSDILYKIEEEVIEHINY